MLQFGKYQLIQPLGKGGMAQVWLAHKIGIAGAVKVCAVKFPRDMFSDEPAQRDALLREARVAMLLNHSNIVQVNDLGLLGALPYIELERIDGVDLAALTEQMRLFSMPWSFSLAAYILQEILEALSYAHTFSIDNVGQGIVHRDVSPHNVLVSTAGEVKLMDFGIAAAASEHSSGMHARGKLRYMAPEHLLTRAVPQSDLFAAGAIFWELLEGKKFRDGRTQADLRTVVINHTVPKLTRPEVPPELARVCYALLEPELDRRVASAEEGLKLLRLWPGSTSERAALRALLARNNITRRSGMTEAEFDVPTWLSAALIELNREAGVTIKAEAAEAAAAQGVPSPGVRSSRISESGPASSRVSSTDATPEATPTPRAPELDPRAAGGRTSRYGDADAPERGGMRPPSSELRSADAITATATGIARPQPRGANKAFVVLAFVLAAVGVAVGTAVLVRNLRRSGTEVATDVASERPAAAATATPPATAEVAAPPPASPTAAPIEPAPTPSGPAPSEPTPSAPTPSEPTPSEPATTPATPVAPDATTVKTPARDKRPASDAGRKPAAAQVEVRARLMLVDYAELQIGNKTVIVDPSADVRVAAGTHAIKWRLTPDEAWRGGGSIAFAEGLSHVLRIGKDGPKHAASKGSSP
ncbi:MAG: protein kinase [Nannocystaceae bacterium]|nr:protein kinase [Nannocystaceae bacterium]